MNKKWVMAMLAALLVCCVAVVAFGDDLTTNSKKEAVKYIEENQPKEINLSGVKMSPADLLEVKNAMPEGSTFHFSTKWGSVEFTDAAEELDLRPKKNSAKATDLDAIVQLCPNLRMIDNTANTSISNDDMVALIEKYPSIQFEWIVHLYKGHTISTKATAYSTFLRIGSDKKVSAKSLEMLKYCPRLKALDLGHNKLKSLDFLQYVPDLELLIIGDNYVTDLTPVGGLKHLQYAELFLNKYTDISPLANCTELLDLNLTANDITDLTALDNVTSIERLWINMCKKLPQEAVDHFIALHPNCEVVFKASHAATVDGWRDHPRYKHYIWCLKNQKWIPFNEDLPIK